MPKRKTKEEFIDNAKKVHGEKYDYSKVEYANNKTKVIIICPKHGEFPQIPKSHLKGRGCPSCIIKTSNTKEFIDKAKKVHGEKYDYSKVEYVHSKIQVTIMCSKHGEFLQIPSNHLRGHRCPACVDNKFNIKKFIDKAKKVHGEKYDYSKVEYTNSKTKVMIICPKHGEFPQIPNIHLMRHGCPLCGTITKTSNTKEFIDKAKKVHGKKYDYSKVKYINAGIQITIICPKHGEFPQTPTVHLMGHGCPSCNESKGEKKITTILSKIGLKFKPQARFVTCKYKNPLPFDFVIKITDNIGALIEYHGEHHYKPVNWNSKMSRKQMMTNLKIIKKRDKIKKEWAKKQSIPLLVIPHWEFDNISLLVEEFVETNYE
jgi:hypothetical protein